MGAGVPSLPCNIFIFTANTLSDKPIADMTDGEIMQRQLEISNLTADWDENSAFEKEKKALAKESMKRLRKAWNDKWKATAANDGEDQ